MAKKNSAFDQVFAESQEKYQEAAKNAGRKGGWQPPDGWKGNFVLTSVEEKEIEAKGKTCCVFDVKFEIADGEFEGRSFIRSIWLPGGEFEMASLATCLAGEEVDDLRKAREIIMGGIGAVIAGACKEKVGNTGKTYTNVYYNKRAA